MTTLNKIRELEPVRLYGYTFVALIVAALVGKGVVNGEVGDYVLTGVTLLLGAAGTEAARSKVTPAARVQTAIEDHAGQVVHGIDEALRNSGIAIPDETRKQIDDVVTAVDYYGRHARRS